jgi:hypothetical protein
MYFFAGDPMNALKTIYPDFDWKPWRFHYVPPGFWEDLKNHRKVIDYIEQVFDITRPEDWKRVTTHQVNKFGGNYLLTWYRWE